MKYKIKELLQREVNYHTKEIMKHKELVERNKSKRQRTKEIKHFHKRFQTIKIAKELGFGFCPCCGGLK